jgi:hypothetical protein
MAAPMIGSFAQRRITATALLLVAVAAVVWGHARLATLMRQVAYLTGWALLAACLFLTLYNARKKLPFLPLGNSRTWLQLHAYVGYLSFALFCAHTGWRWPHGGFEQTLAVLFLAVAVSGVLGLLWSRIVPRRLTARGGEVLFERIPIVRRQLADRAQELALQSVASTKSTVIADFYNRHLAGFLAHPQHLALHLLEARGPLSRLQSHLEDLNRFLSPEQRPVLAEIAGIVRQKDALDYQLALQLSLRLWLFLHIPLTYSLLIFTVQHVVLVFGFSSGVNLP